MEPVPFAVVAYDASLDNDGNVSLDGIVDTFLVDGAPSVLQDITLFAIFELSPEEVDRPRSVLTRIIDPDGGEIDVWRVNGFVKRRGGSSTYLYYLLVQYPYTPFGQLGRHEVRIQYDVDRPELAVQFEIQER
jgi:hypothetical protein